MNVIAVISNSVGSTTWTAMSCKVVVMVMLVHNILAR